MDFNLGLVNEAAQVLRLSLGPEWLAEEAFTPDLGDAWGHRAHPIGTALAQADERGVALALELAEYLKFLAPLPSFATVVTGLKADFRSGLLQLSFAYRVARLGATDVVLEPPVEGGRLGDVGFTLFEQPFVVECYVQRAARWTTSQEGMWLVRKVPKLLERHQLTASIAIQLKRQLDAAVRKQLLSTIQRLATQLTSQAASNSLIGGNDAWLVSVARTVPGGPLMVHPGFPTNLGEPLMGMRSQMVPRAYVDAVAANPALWTRPRGLVHNQLAIWADPADSAEHSLEQDLDRPLARLASRLRTKKRAQTRVPGAARVLLCESWLSRELNRATPEELARFQREVFGPRDFRGCLLFVERRYGERSHRHRFVPLPIHSAPPGPGCERFAERLMEQERSLAVPALKGPEE
ncbi:MAG: hypothetical protein ACLPJH_00240 [Myxococcaceae bacterium]